ncbi:MAG: hypothetical protein AAFZ15_09410 [Bacteroidota bacterium]
MYKSKLLTLFRTLTAAEWKAFGKFLHSPYLNSNKRLIPFYGYLKKHHPRFDHKQLEKPTVFAALFSEKAKYDDKLLRATMADLHKAAMRFLAHKQLVEDELLQMELQARHFGQKDNYQKFEKTRLAELEKKATDTVKDMDYFYRNFLAYYQLYFFPGKAGSKISATYLEQADEHLHLFYAVASTRIEVEKRDRDSRLAGQTGKTHLLNIKKWLQDNNLKIPPSIILNRGLINLLEQKKGNHPYFSELKKNYFNSYEILDQFDQKLVFQKLQNYINKEYLKGHAGYLSELLDMYKFGLSKKLFFYGNEIHENTFINIAVTGAACKDFVWTKNFIDDYALFLSPILRDDAKAFANASLAFNQGNFVKATSYLRRIANTGFYYKLRVAPLTIRCFFELYIRDESYFDLLISKIEAFEKYLKRKHLLSEQRILAYNNFCKFVTKLAIHTYSHSNHKYADKKSLNRITEEKTTINRRWILEKINEIKSR